MVGDLLASSIKRAIAQDLSVAELFGAVERLNASGEAVLARELYNVWIRHNGEHPLLHAVCFNYGVALSDANDLEGAKAAFSEAIRINPSFVPPYINLGTVYERLGAPDQAVSHWNQAAGCLAPVTPDAILHKTTALKQIGRVLETARHEATAENILQQSLEIDPHQRDVVQHWFALRQCQCKWPVVAPFGRVSRQHLMRGVSPLSLAAHVDDPIFQLANAHHYNKHDVLKGEAPIPERTWPALRRRRRDRLKVGYVSSDLREHAIGFLTAEYFELHNREKVETFAYYSGVRADDGIQARIKAGVEHWSDITELSDDQAVQLIMNDGIDILVDVNGYTKDARVKVFAMRPAPIIVNWLGFPGTMGSAYHNYIVADPHIIPPGHEIYSAERVLRLPCYQPNDRKRHVAARRITRAEAGLPEVGTVYCCFNGTQKLTRPTFESWMAILRVVPDSVLWLLTGTEETNARLRQEAEQLGVAAARVVFAGKRANPEHLARYPLADLFLDTAPYGAHTTASDAMWMGVPALTVPGRSFASRVCSSLVRAAGLPELVCRTRDEYVALAIELGRNPERLLDLRHRLAENRDRCQLFDTPSLVASMEALYELMWSEFSEDKLQRPDLSHLELLHEIGCEDGHEERIAWLSGEDYHAYYRARLESRGALAALAHGRLESNASNVLDFLPTPSEPAIGRARATSLGTATRLAHGF
jgi:predicted O-linked N-acetylglucosamine transferase (SPINDLY family)